MSGSIHLATHLSVAEPEQRYRAAHEPHERSWWQILWLLARGQTAAAIADTTSYNRGWIGQIAKRYNDQGPDAMVNRQHTTSWRAPRMLSAMQQEELRQALNNSYHGRSSRRRIRLATYTHLLRSQIASRLGSKTLQAAARAPARLKGLGRCTCHHDASAISTTSARDGASERSNFDAWLMVERRVVGNSLRWHESQL